MPQRHIHEEWTGEWRERERAEQNKSIRIFLSQAIWNANEFSIFFPVGLEFMEIIKKSPKKKLRVCVARVCERLEVIDQQ